MSGVRATPLAQLFPNASGPMRPPLALNSGATGSTCTRWGFGLAQEVDAAAMTLWIKVSAAGVENHRPQAR
jgi:hypothetical protein